MTRKQYLEAILEIAEDAPTPYGNRTLAEHQKTLDDFDERMGRIYEYTQTLLGIHPKLVVEEEQ